MLSANGGATATDSKENPYDLTALTQIAGIQTAVASSATAGYDPARPLLFNLRWI
jgi:hypothetical protein